MPKKVIHHYHYGWQGHLKEEICRFFLTTELRLSSDASPTLSMIVSTVGLRLELSSRNILPIYPGTGVFFETAVFHANTEAPAQEMATVRVSESSLRDNDKRWVGRFGPGEDAAHLEWINRAHFGTVAMIRGALLAGDRFGKLTDAPSLGYPW